MRAVKSLITVTYLMFLTLGCNLCKNRLIDAIDDPSRQWTAYQFQRDCDATNKNLTFLSIKLKNHRYEFEKNTALVVIEDSVKLDYVWAGSKLLKVRIPRSSLGQVRRRYMDFEGIHIDFVDASGKE